ncbi:MAG TPA: methyl-accepting chemotaxis protein [Patescibacteria group bacterium]|nr:methyl-accepting chemotaxis protein [Patescibacteria group bacterium]
MKWIQNQKIAKKLTGAFSIILFMIAGIGIYSVLKFREVNEILHSVNTNLMPTIEVINKLNVDLGIFRVRELRHVTSTTKEEKANFEQELVRLSERIDEELAVYQPMLLEEEKPHYNKLVIDLQEFRSEHKKILNLSNQLKNAEALEILKGRSHHLFNKEMMPTLETLVRLNFKLTTEAALNGEKINLRASNINIIFALVCFVVGIFLSMYVSRMISKPVIALDEAANKVAGGDMNVKVDIDAKDELGNLGTAFNEMILKIRTANEEAASQQAYLNRSVQNMLGEMEKFSNGDLTVHVQAERDDEIGLLFNGFNRSIENLRGMILQLAEAVSTSAAAATQISSSTEELSAGAQEQSAQTHEVAAAVEEMTSTILDNAKSASHAADIASTNQKTAVNGGEIVQQTIQMIRQVSEVVQDSAIKIEKLGVSSSEIGEIVSVIDDIADQTNLLALNAAIEAARAGEQGRGFAVVADEVRKLAERTTNATKQIATMIKGIQNDTKEAVTGMNKGSQEVSHGIKLADKADEVLKEIVHSSKEVFDNVSQIAAASEEQSATSEQISRSVTSISSVTSQSAAGIEQIARSADELNRLTENIFTLISQFKVDSTADFTGMPETRVIAASSLNGRSRKTLLN